MTETTPMAEAISYFVDAYKAELSGKLQTEMDEEGDLDSVVKEWGIEGDFLNSVDETAYTLTMSNYAWRIGRDELHDALQDPDIYQGIDYDAIVAKVKNA